MSMSRVTPKVEEELARLLEAVGARVRAAREGLGLTVSALAQQAGITRTTYYRVEAGDGRVSLATYAQVLQLLDLEQSLGRLAQPNPRTVVSRSRVAHAPAKARPAASERGDRTGLRLTTPAQPGLEQGQLP